MNYNETLNYIHSLGNFSKPAGLERITEALEKLDNPQKALKAIHIAGTNGKGSVSVMLSSVFIAAGYKTGLFISPFIIDFRERIQINGEYISEEALIEYSKRVIDTEVELTEFEFITAVAFLYFKERNIDILICETGLGGRLDATNILTNKLVNVITKIGLDHTSILGDTLEKIAEEKCGILRNCPSVTIYAQPPEVLKTIKNRAEKLFVTDADSLYIEKSDFGNTFIYKGEKYDLLLSGDYQIENSLLAIEAVKQSGYNITYETIYNGLSSAFFPARMEVISKEPLVVLDGAHNPDGAKVLSAELKKQKSKPIAIIGMMKDKNYKTFLNTTLKHCETAIAVEVEGISRSLKADELKLSAENVCKCITAENYIDAVSMASSLSKGRSVFIFGSLYLASAIRPYLKEYFK